MRRAFPASILFVAAVSCSSTKSSLAPDPWEGPLKLAKAVDLNPDPHVLEVNLDATYAEWQISPTQTVHAMTYNGSVPGPLLEAHVGDTLVVHFTNHLTEPTTIHWHGVRVPAAMDGSPMAQPPVQPGASFDYRFQLTDAGTFWYHPHGDEPVQMEHGMYGAIVVRGDAEPAMDAEGVVMLDDLTLGADGQIAPPGGAIEEHSGREGPISLLNGGTGLTVPIRAGQRQRWRIVNAGSARFYRLAIPGHTFTVLGTDGGFIAQPYEASELFMVPGDRLDVIVTGSAAPGTSATLQNLPYDRGHGGGSATTMDLATIAYDSASMSGAAVPASTGRLIDPLSTVGATTRTIVFDELIDPNTGDTTFTVDGKAYPDVPSFDAHVGITEVWELQNKSGMDHPFHLHGFFFQVLGANGGPLSWEDSIQLKAKSTTRIAFSPDDRQGMWMYHCHILEHVKSGMMADFRLTK